MSNEEYLVLMINTLTENKTSLDYPLSAKNPRFDTDLSELIKDMIFEYGVYNAKEVLWYRNNGYDVMIDSEFRFKEWLNRKKEQIKYDSHSN